MTNKLSISDDTNHPSYKMFVGYINSHRTWAEATTNLKDEWRAQIVFKELRLDNITFEQEQDMIMFVLRFS